MSGNDVQAVRIIGITAMAWGLRAPSGIDRFWMRGLYGALDSVGEAKQSPSDGDGATAGAFSWQRMASIVAVGAGEAEGVMA